jgi:hypothetical protein
MRQRQWLRSVGVTQNPRSDAIYPYFQLLGPQDVSNVLAFRLGLMLR